MTIRHPSYRAFESWRVETNDATMATLIGLRYAGDTLAKLDDGERSKLLPEITDVPEVERMNQTGDRVVQKLHEAETMLSVMAIPFHMAVLGEFLVSAVDLLRTDDQATSDTPTHQLGFAQTRTLLEGVMPDWGDGYWDALTFIQKVRNSIAHDGAIVAAGLVNVWTARTTEARELWLRLAGRPPALVLGTRMPIGPGELRATLAVTNGVAQQVNDGLSRVVSRQRWLDVAIEDWEATRPSVRWDRTQAPAAAVRWCQAYYSDLRMTESEAKAALLVKSRVVV